MYPSPGIQCGPAPARDAGQPIAPVLIQVPALPRARGASRRPSRQYVGPSRTAGVRRRRRLRREVRVAGSAILFGVPMAWAMLTLWSPGTSADAAPQGAEPARVAVAARDPEIRQGPRTDCVVSGEVVDDGPPWATISLEPTRTSQPGELTSPVVEPAGYLLPAESGEETFHAGG